VQFSKAVQVLLQDSQQVLVECGPRRTCVALAHQHRPSNPSRVISCMPDSAEPDDEYASVLLGLGALWLNGCMVDWCAFHDHEQRRHVALPGYPFQRKRYWLEPGNTASFGLDAAPRLQPAKSAAPSEPGSNDGQEGSSGRDDVMTALVALLEEALGAKIEAFDGDAQFVALGLDSLLVTQFARMVRMRLDFPVTFRQLSERYASPKLLADAIRAARATASGAPAVVPRNACAVAAVSASPSSASAPAQVPRAGDIQMGTGPSKASVPGARLGRDEHGRPAWFVPDPGRPGKFCKVEDHE
jgi:acyl transferase domain-containing protein